MLYSGIGFFICIFGIYGCLAYYAFLSRVGLSRLGPAGAGPWITFVAAAAVTAAVVVFDRTLVAHVDSGVQDLDAHKGAARANDQARLATYLHPLGRRSYTLFLARLFLALVIGVFATQTIELVVFGNDIRNARYEQLEQTYRAQLSTARERRAEDNKAFEADQRSKLRSAETQSHYSVDARRGQHKHCRPRTTCATSLAESKRLFRQYTENGRAGPLQPSSPDSQAIVAIEAELAELRTRSARVLAAHEGLLQDIEALYAYIGGNALAFAYYFAFTIVFLCVDLAALLLKYSFAVNSEYERRQAGRQRLRWQRFAANLAREEQLAMPSPEEDAAAQAAAKQERTLDAELAARPHQLRRDALADAYARAARGTELASAANAFVNEALSEKHAFARPQFDQSAPAAAPARDGSPASDAARAQEAELAHEQLAATKHLHAQRAKAGLQSALQRPVDRDFLISVLGAVGGIIAFVYLLGGAYTYSQLQQASLPTSALAYIPTRAMLRAGIVVAALSLAFIGGVIWIIKALAPKIQRLSGYESFGEALTATWALLWGRIKGLFSPPGPSPSRSVRRAVTSPVAGGTAAITAAATFATELTDGGLVGGLAIFGTGLIALLTGLAVLALFGLFHPRSGLSRSGAIFLVTVFATLGAYEAGQLRPFKLPVAELQLVGQSTCLDAGFLGEDSGNIYLVDGHDHKLRVLPAREVIGFAIAARPIAVADGRMKPANCSGAVLAPGHIG